MSKFFVLQGEIERIEEYSQQCLNAFGGGDMVIEEVRLYNTKALFLEQHIVNLSNTLSLLQIPIPQKFDAMRISRYITRLLNVNKVYKGGICKIIIFRKANLFQGLDIHKTAFAIFIESLDNLDFTFNAEGFKIATQNSLVVYPPYLPSLYTGHTLVKNKLLRMLELENLDAYCLYNFEKSVFNTSFGDLFYVFQDKIYTPNHVLNPSRLPITDMLISFAKKNGVEILQVKSVAELELIESSELFLCNTIDGIRWVHKCNEAVYGYKVSKKLFQIFTKMIEIVSKH